MPCYGSGDLFLEGRIKGKEIRFENRCEGHFAGDSKTAFVVYGIAQTNRVVKNEMEFRYDHGHESVFSTLVGYLCDLAEI